MSHSKKAILLANLGSPDSYSVSDVRNYLNEFLMDGNVIDIPYPVRFMLVKGIIVPFRAPKSAEKYKSIWTEQGSPLIHISEQQSETLEQISGLPVYLCMRYGNPTPQAALKKMHEEHPGLEEVVLVPLYPHYAMSSYKTAVEHVEKAWKEGGYKAAFRTVAPFYAHPAYIGALVKSIRPYLTQHFDHLLFSYHGIPERHVQKTDCTGKHCLKQADCCNIPSPAHAFCYRHQVFETTRLVAEQLGLENSRYSVSFQSRLGKDKWLSPDSASEFKRLPENGKKNLLVVCPAFVSDCLETLEEVLIEGRETFMHAGGLSFTYIPCLNTDKEWIAALNQLQNEA